MCYYIPYIMNKYTENERPKYRSLRNTTIHQNTAQFSTQIPASSVAVEPSNISTRNTREMSSRKSIVRHARSKALLTSKYVA